MIAILRPALVSLALFTLLTGVAYPLVVTAIGQWVFPLQAAGSLVVRNGEQFGSLLIGQQFSAPRYVWGRPSATAPMPYNAAGSGGSNLGPLNPALIEAIKARVESLRAADPGNTAPIPVELVTASGSGLDPEISLAGALYQAPRVARARAMAVDAVERLIAGQAEDRLLGFLGTSRVNVLRLNLALDAAQAGPVQ